MGQALSALTSFAPVPASPVHEHSERSWPGAAGCAVHASSARTPRVPEIAHSTCGHTADGDEWTYTTPWVLPLLLTAEPPLLDEGTSSPTPSRCGGPRCAVWRPA